MIIVKIRIRNLTVSELDELGEFCVRLLSGTEPWISRRKESITVLDEASLRRQQSVDFCVDAIDSLDGYRDMCQRIFGFGIRIAPLFILDKDPYASLAFDLKDEAGRSLSLMTREENGLVSAATLKVLCRNKLRDAEFAHLPSSLEEKVEQLALADASGGVDWLDRLQNPLPGDPAQKEINALLERPGEDGEMSWWLNTLAVSSIVLVALEPSRAHRRVIKISYEQSVERERPRLPARLGWRSFKTRVRSPLIRSGHYHLEVKAPPDFRLTGASLVVDRTKGRQSSPGFRRRAQLYRDGVNDARGAIAQFSLRVSGRGVLGGALTASILVLVAILACMNFSDAIAEGSTGGPALLLVLPGLIATYAARSDQHGLTTRLLAIPRWILLLFAGVSAYYAAGMVALIGPVEQGLEGAKYLEAVEKHSAAIDTWLTYAAIAAGISVVTIGMAWVCTRELTHKVLRWCYGKWLRYVRSRFDIQVTLGMLPQDAWRQVEREFVHLGGGRLFQNATARYVQNRECILHREGEILRAIHGARTAPAPGGTTLNWVFWATGPVLLKPIIAAFVLWEKRATHRRIAKLSELSDSVAGEGGDA